MFFDKPGVRPGVALRVRHFIFTDTSNQHRSR